MRNVWLVIKHEILSMLGKPSFWITTFVLPAIVMLFSFGGQFISSRVLEEEVNVPSGEETGVDGERALTIGYVDRAGVIETLPPDLPGELFRSFPDVDAARSALEAGDVTQYYVFPADYVERGEIEVVQGEFAPLGDIGTLELMRYVLNYNLVDDKALARRVNTPIQAVEARAIAADDQETDDDGSGTFIAFVTLFIFFFIFTMSSGFMLRSVTQEKENRTVEVLLVSLRPRELMLGKVLGLGVIALLQMALWFGGVILALQRGDGLLSNFGLVVHSLELPTSFFVWALLYFVLSYLLYASVLGAIGALAPNARETGPFTFLALLPLFIPFFLNTTFTQAPHGPIATALSLFPLTAPTAMVPRLAVGGVPLWQTVTALIGLAIATVVFVLLSARFFRADTLLSSTELKWERIVKEFKRGGA